MKNTVQIFLSCAFTLCATFWATSQQILKETLSLGSIVPYEMEVAYDKTSHLIFPSAIRYVDLGSEYLLAAKADDAQNVLRIKASVKGFDAETNFSVITDDGRFYSFDVTYNTSPQALSYNLHTISKSADKNNSQDVLFEELGNTPPSLAGLILETIYKNDKRVIKHIGSESFQIQFYLKGIYIHNGKYYFHTELANRSNVAFGIDFINFKVVDKKTAKRTVLQQRPLLPLRFYKILDTVDGRTKEQNVFLLDQFTIADDKILVIEIFEKNGSRHQRLEVENSDLIKAKLISDMQLKF